MRGIALDHRPRGHLPRSIEEAGSGDGPSIRPVDAAALRAALRHPTDRPVTRNGRHCRSPPGQGAWSTGKRHGARPARQRSHRSRVPATFAIANAPDEHAPRRSAARRHRLRRPSCDRSAPSTGWRIRCRVGLTAFCPSAIGGLASTILFGRKSQRRRSVMASTLVMPVLEAVGRRHLSSPLTNDQNREPHGLDAETRPNCRHLISGEVAPPRFWARGGATGPGRQPNSWSKTPLDGISATSTAGFFVPPGLRNRPPPRGNRVSARRDG